MNEQLLLEQVRYSSPLSRAELARISGLSKPTVALALEKSGAFANIVFRAPITREPQTGLEHFQLGAAIVEPKP